MSASGTAGARLAGEERILDWEGCLNARDTGGLLTADGGLIRRGALVRTDVLSRITPSGRAALIEHGVRTIVDVRTPEEVALDAHLYPFGTGKDESVRHLNVPFTLGREDVSWEQIKVRYEAAVSRAELNRIDLEAHAQGIAQIVAAVADAPSGGVLVHCHAGKDRTGVVVALLLALAGVSDDDIADDYALTMLNLDQLIDEWLAEMGGTDAEQQRLRGLATPSREAMLDTLEYLRERFGGAERFLLDAGITQTQLARLRERLVDRRRDDDG